MAAAAVQYMTSGQVKTLLRQRFGAPEWACFFEVGDATGARAGRWADALAMNLWPSRGLALHGFEIKVSRSDWQSELRKPEKSAAIQRFCDHWWIVTPAGLVRDGELPPTWGLYEVTARGLVCKVQAPKLEAEPLTRPFVAAVLRQAGNVSAEERNAAINKALEADRAAINGRVDEEVKRRSRKYEELSATIAKFEEASGVKIDTWRPQDIGKAVKLITDAGIVSTYHGVRTMAENARQFADRIDKALAELEPPATVVDADALIEDAA